MTGFFQKITPAKKITTLLGKIPPRGVRSAGLSALSEKNSNFSLGAYVVRPMGFAEKKKNSMPDFCTATATRRGAGSHDRWGSMAGGLTPTTTARPMRPDGVRCEPMATAQTPATTPPIHPHWRPSVGDRRGSAGIGGRSVVDQRGSAGDRTCQTAPSDTRQTGDLSGRIRGYPTPPANTPHQPPSTHQNASDFFGSPATSPPTRQGVVG